MAQSTPPAAAAPTAAAAPSQPPSQPEPTCRRIQVSREKRPLNFFVTLSKKFLVTDPVVELSGLGLAVTTVVTIAEILKNAGLVDLEHIKTSLVEPRPDGHTTAPKAKIQIWIRKTPQFDSLITNHNSNVLPYNPTQQQRQAASDAASQEAGDTNPLQSAASASQVESLPEEDKSSTPDKETEANATS